MPACTENGGTSAGNALLLSICRPIAGAQPVERVWKLTRRKATHNQYFSTLASVAVAVESVFDEWRTGNATLKRVCAL